MDDTQASGVRGVNGSANEVMDTNDGQGRKSASRRSSTVQEGSHTRSYKEMLEVLKQVSKSCDAVSEKICDLNLNYARLATKSSMLIDPDVAKIVLVEEENYPEVLTSSQKKDKSSREKMDEKYAEMSRTLSHREKNQSFNENR